MPVINDTNDANDPRKNVAPANPTTPPPVTAQPPPALAQQPQSIPPEPPQPPKPVINSGDLIGEPATIDNFQPASEDLDVSQQESESLPVAGADPVVASEAPVTDPTNVFPTVNDVNTDIAEQVAGQVDAGLEAQRNTLQNQTLNGSRYPFLLEIEGERARLQRMLDQSNQRLRLFIRDQARREATQQLQAPLNPRNLQTFKQRELNPGLNLDPLRSLGNWGVGILREIYDNARPPTGDPLVDDPVLRRFRPFGRTGQQKSFRDFAMDVLENPVTVLNPIAGLLTAPLREGEFGDFGDGVLGALFYGLSLPGNIVQGGLTDLHNKLTGQENLESNIPNFMQAMVGQDFSFSELSAPVTRTTTDPITGKVTTEEIARGANPLAVVGPRENPQTIGELRERSWIWRLGPDILTLGATRLIPEDVRIPEFLPSRTFQTVEFGAGLLLDVLTPEPGDLVALGSRLVRRATPEVTAGLARIGDDVTDIVVPDEVLLGELVDDVAETVQGEFVDIATPPTVRRALDPETIDVPASTVLDDVTNLREAPSLPEVDVLRSSTQPIRLPNINDVLDNSSYRQGAAEEALAGLGLDLNLPVNPQVVTAPSPLAALPPAGETGRLGRTEFFRKIAIGDLDNIDLSPEVTTNVRRSNAQLTQLATDAGLLPQRNTPLSARRIELLNQQYPGMFERYGQPLHRVSSQQLAQKALPPERLTTAELIAAKFRASGDIDLRTADDFTQQAARAGDFVLDKAVNSPQGIRETSQLMRSRLPRNLQDFSDIPGVQRLLRNEQIYEALSDEAQTLSQVYVEQVETLNRTLDVLEDTVDDIGRRDLFDSGTLPNGDDILTQLDELGAGEEFFPAGEGLVGEVSEVTRRVNEGSWFHGTRVVDFSPTFSDPLQGAARSELGIGIHYTRNNDLAFQYVQATPASNVPNIGQTYYDGIPDLAPSRERGNVFEINGRFRNTVDANAPLTDEVRNSLLRAIDASPLPTNARRSLRTRVRNNAETYEKVFRDIDDVLSKMFNDQPYPEKLVLDIQRRVTSELRNSGFDSVFYRQGDFEQLTVLAPSTRNLKEAVRREVFTNVLPLDAVSQATARRNVDRISTEIFPKSKYAHTNFKESQASLLTRMTEDTAQQLEEVNNLADSVANEVANADTAIRNKLEAQRKTRRAQQERRWKNQNTDQIRHFSKPDDTFC